MFPKGLSCQLHITQRCLAVLRAPGRVFSPLLLPSGSSSTHSSQNKKPSEPSVHVSQHAVCPGYPSPRARHAAHTPVSPRESCQLGPRGS
ncbi:unnamed protein product [Rangifer tarandus platyrhynchus]|uniref:Uncharacterized protein n=1 Tax=Rangifer tarandus platyrhynchus TaxID=3082113 RepID=A0ABN8ZDN6_RANTA|nr:unnamed protein product [Rangifer tarandus platyrhynchus]